MATRVSKETNFLTLHPSCAHDSGLCVNPHTLQFSTTPDSCQSKFQDPIIYISTIHLHS